MHCAGLDALPSIPPQPLLSHQCPSIPPSSDTAVVMVNELVVKDSNIAKMRTRKLYNEYHMSSLKRMALTDCMMLAIEEHSFYEMSGLQNLNFRYLALLAFKRNCCQKVSELPDL